jgi:hypothetical protein
LKSTAFDGDAVDGWDSAWKRAGHGFIFERADAARFIRPM